MRKKDIILIILGIVILILLAFFVSLAIREITNFDSNKEKEIEEKIEIDGKKIEFKTYRVDQSFFINVPSEFVMLDEEMLKQEYDYNSRPELVFRSEDNAEKIFISTTEEAMTDAGLEAYLNNKIAESTNMQLLDSGIYTKHAKTFAKIVVVDSTTNMYYNIRYFTLNDKLVSVEFNTASTNYTKWEKVIEKIMDSLCFNEDDITK